MTVKITSLIGTSQTLDSVALAAFASQYRPGSLTTMSAALIAAVAAKSIQAVDDHGVDQIATAALTLTRNDSGKVIYLDSATEFVTTLPALELGLRFTFVVKAAPSGADYTIVSASAANNIKGSVASSDLNAATDGDLETSGGDTISFVGAKAVAGDRVDLVCDGTNWFARGHCSVFDAITITTAA